MNSFSIFFGRVMSDNKQQGGERKEKKKNEEDDKLSTNTITKITPDTKPLPLFSSINLLLDEYDIEEFNDCFWHQADKKPLTEFLDHLKQTTTFLKATLNMSWRARKNGLDTLDEYCKMEHYMQINDIATRRKIHSILDEFGFYGDSSVKEIDWQQMPPFISDTFRTKLNHLSLNQFEPAIEAFSTLLKQETAKAESDIPLVLKHNPLATFQSYYDYLQGEKKYQKSQIKDPLETSIVSQVKPLLLQEIKQNSDTATEETKKGLKLIIGEIKQEIKENTIELLGCIFGTLIIIFLVLVWILVHLKYHHC